jgi:hypothetical protein
VVGPTARPYAVCVVRRIVIIPLLVALLGASSPRADATLCAGRFLVFDGEKYGRVRVAATASGLLGAGMVPECFDQGVPAGAPSGTLVSVHRVAGVPPGLAVIVADQVWLSVHANRADLTSALDDSQGREWLAPMLAAVGGVVFTAGVAAAWWRLRHS